MDRVTFTKTAAPMKCDLGKSIVYAMPRDFSSGNSGWYATGKVLIDVGGELVACQVSLSVVVIGSKDWADALPAVPKPAMNTPTPPLPFSGGPLPASPTEPQKAPRNRKKKTRTEEDGPYHEGA